MRVFVVAVRVWSELRRLSYFFIIFRAQVLVRATLGA